MTGTDPTVQHLADTIVAWQAPSGGIDVDRCVFHSHTPLDKPSAYGQDVPWLVRALYTVYDSTLDPRYKAAADRYAVYFLAGMYPTAPTFAIGDALDPCLSGYRRHNPHDDALDHKAHAMRDWIVDRRTDNGHVFDVGYPWRDDRGEYRQGSDAAFSNDLSDVGRALVFHGRRYGDETSLGHAVDLARFFLRTHVPGSVDGVWSDKLGTWLIGPHPARGFENVDEYSDAAGWGWTSYYASHYLHRLHDAVTDTELRAEIRAKCVSSLRWTFDACQFADGAVGMSGRDDKWLGMTGLAILLYHEVQSKGWLAGDVEREYHPKALRAMRWLRSAARPENFPPNGFVAVTGATQPEPAWNTSWMMGIVLEALVVGRGLQFATPGPKNADG